MIKSGMETIRRALRRLRYLGFQHRYGGLMDDYRLARKALAVIEKIEDPQHSLDSEGDDADA